MAGIGGGGAGQFVGDGVGNRVSYWGVGGGKGGKQILRFAQDDPCLGVVFV